MNNVLKEVKDIPKDHAETEEQKFVDYTEQFSELSKLIGRVESAVQAQETNVEAPVVNLPETVVNVEKPDLKPLTKDLKAVEKAIKKIVIPAQIHTDTSKIEKELKASNKLLKEIRDTPSGGGGGSSSIAPFMVEGALPTASPTLANRVDDTVANTVYIGNAPIGSGSSGAVWQIKRLDTSSGVITMWADGDSQFNNIWDNRASLSYS